MKSIRSKSKLFAQFGVFLFLFFGSSLHAAEPFTCDGTPYTVIGDPSTVQSVDRRDLSVHDLTQLNPNINVNGIAYNILDNYIYGQANSSLGGTGINQRDIVQIGVDGNLTNLGSPGTGFSPATHNGTMDSDGNYYSFSNTHLYIVHIGTNPTADSLTFTSKPLDRSSVGNNSWRATYDWTFNVNNGRLYGTRGGRLYDVNISSGVVTEIATTGDALPSNAGGAWSTSKGVLYFYSNQDGTLTSVEIQADGRGKVAYIGTVAKNGQFDATACRPPYITKNANTRELEAGGSFTYEFSIYNPFTKPIDVNFTDTLPTALDYNLSSLTPSAPGGGTVVNFDSDKLRIEGITLPINGRVDFSVSVVVDANINSETDISNTAYIQYGVNIVGSDDPGTNNVDDNTTVHVNVPPTAVDDTASVTEDAAPNTAAGDMRANDSDEKDLTNALVISDVNGTNSGSLKGKYGTLTWNANGSYTYALDNNNAVVNALGSGETLQEHFVYTLKDTDGLTDTANLIITINGADDPVATDDSVTAQTGETAVVDVLGNDSFVDPATVKIVDGNGNEVTSLTVPDEGTWSVDPVNGKITFTPESGFTGDPTPIEYTVIGDNGSPYSATVTVDYPQTAPVAADDAVYDSNPATPSSPTTISVLTNDADPENDINASSVNFDPASVSGAGSDTDGDGDIDQVIISGEGTWSVSANGTVTFTPEAGFSTDPTPITYTVKDNTGLISNEATIRIFYPKPPVAINDSQSTSKDTSVSIPVLNNDYDPDGDMLRITSVGTSTNEDPYTTANGGTVVWNAGGSMVYTPPAGYVGTDTYEYTISDGNGGTDTATVTMTITDSTDPDTNTVTAVGDSASTPMDIGLTIPVLTNDYDAEGDNFAISSIVADPAHGTITINSDGTVTYAPDSGFIGVDTFEYEITDEKGVTDTAIVSVTVTDPSNPVPNAVADSATTKQNVPVAIDVLVNDTHPNSGEVLAVTGFTQPANGTVAVDDGGTPNDPGDDQLIYTPNAGFTGNDTFMYTITDANGDSATAAVTVTVASADAPVKPGVQPDKSSGNTPGEPVTVDVLGNDVTDADPSTVQIVGTNQPGDPLVVPGEGTWTINPQTGAITFTPEPGFTGDPTPIGYTVEDAIGNRSAAASVTILYGTASSPGGLNAVDDTVRVTHYGPNNGTLVSNDTLGAGTKSEHVWALATPPAHGTVVVNPDGTYTYTPDADYNGPDSFTYTITDANGNQDTATVNIDVDCASSQTSDSGDAFGALSMFFMMMLTGIAGLYFVRKEEERGEL